MVIFWKANVRDNPHLHYVYPVLEITSVDSNSNKHRNSHIIQRKTTRSDFAEQREKPQAVDAIPIVHRPPIYIQAVQAGEHVTGYALDRPVFITCDKIWQLWLEHALGHPWKLPNPMDFPYRTSCSEDLKTDSVIPTYRCISYLFNDDFAEHLNNLSEEHSVKV